MLFVAGMENPPTNKQTAAGLLDGDEEPWTVELRRCLGWQNKDRNIGPHVGSAMLRIHDRDICRAGTMVRPGEFRQFGHFLGTLLTNIEPCTLPLRANPKLPC